MNIRAADSYDDFLDGILQQLTAETGVLQAASVERGYIAPYAVERASASTADVLTT